MKYLKKILKVIGILVVFVLLIGIYTGVTYYYQFKIKPHKELENFDASKFAYKFSDGKLSIPDERFDQYTVIDSLHYENFLEISESRTVLSLNGIWDIAEGDFDEIPTDFNSKVPVPGFADLAEPAFKDVGNTPWYFGLGFLKPSQLMANMKFKDANREAFWYKKEFTIEGAVTDNAILKVHRAKYGSAVWLNGVKLGQNGKNFQPGYFDASKALKGNGAANEMIVRVGTSVTYDQNNQNIYGDALEKNRHLPGIYDDVELQLSGNVRIEKVQVVPNIEKETARVIAWVKNEGSPIATSLKFGVSEYQQSSLVGAVETAVFKLEASESKIVEVEIPIANCKLWSPESPNLYQLHTVLEGDSLNTRFGMRSFEFDSTSKVPMLNNRPYYLRGTSVPLYRYNENPYRKDELWNEAWVRTVFKRFKEMNWNVVRFHVGTAPSMWYRIADEEGMIVQDEYAIWGYNLFRMGLPLETFVEEYIGWMEEHWNYASILIWDAQNESTEEVEPRTGYALNIVRGLDESNRPWDNGWGAVQGSGDVKEEHPYMYKEAMFNPSGDDLKPMKSLSVFNSTNPDSIFTSDKGNPVLVNEYSWLWVRRDGKGAGLTEAGFAKYFPNATAEENFERYAYDCAAQTEYYRALRAAGVMQFAGLSSNYEGCKTTDIFSDIETLTVEPHIEKYLKNAFAPLGICIFNWSESFEASSTVEIPVVLINDTYTSWNGMVNLKVKRNEEIVKSSTVEGIVSEAGKAVIVGNIQMPETPGKYQLEASIEVSENKWVSSIRKFEIK